MPQPDNVLREEYLNWTLPKGDRIYPSGVETAEWWIAKLHTQRDEIQKEWNKIHLLDHHDESNDSFWEKEYGNFHVRSMHISEYEKFSSFLSNLNTNKTQS